MAAVTAYRTGDRTHAALRGYKDAATAAARTGFAHQLSAMLGQFFERHGGCLLAGWGTIDAVCTVPTKRRGAGRGDPLAAVAGEVPWVAVRPRILLAPGPGPVGHLVASRTAFIRTETGGIRTETGGIRSETGGIRTKRASGTIVGGGGRTAGPDRGDGGRRVLVLDDTWTTGAHARSAAAAVDRGGDRVVGILVIGRCVDPAASAAAAAWWRAATAAALRREPGPAAGGEGRRSHGRCDMGGSFPVAPADAAPGKSALGDWAFGDWAFGDSAFGDSAPGESPPDERGRRLGQTPPASHGPAG